MADIKEDKSMLPFDVLQNKIRILMEKEKQQKEGGDDHVDQHDGEQEEQMDDEARSGEAIDEDDCDDEDDQQQQQQDEDQDEERNSEDEEAGEDKEDDGEGEEEGEGEGEEEIGMFGVELEKLMELQGDDNGDVPMILVVLIEKIISMRGLKTEGIFRVNGNLADVERLAVEGFDPESEDCKIYSVFTWASLLKKWIRELPNRLIPESLYQQFIECKSPDDIKEKIIGVMEENEEQLECKLERNVLNTVGLFFGQLLSDRNVSFTKMTLENVSIILTPTLFKPHGVQMSLENIKEVMEQQKNQLESVKHLLLYYKQLYSQQQRQLQFDILQQQQQQQQQQSPKPKQKHKKNKQRRYNRKR